jgi:predicted kinase
MHTDMESILDSAQGGGSINDSINGTTERNGISGDHNHSHDHPMPRSQLVVQMSGAPGAGKSTIGNLLAKTIGAVLIDHDVLRSFFLDIGEDFDIAAEHAYRLQWVLTEFYLKKERSVVVDSTCNYQVTLDTGSNLARRYACTYRYVECRLGDIDVLENRLRSRDSLRSQRKSIYSDPVDYQKLNVPGLRRDAAATFQTWIDSSCRPNHGVIVIHTTNDPATCLQDLLKQIDVDVDVRTEDRINEKGAGADIDNDSRLNVSHLEGAQPSSPLSSNGVQGTEHLQQPAGSVHPVVLVAAPTFPSDKPR